MKILLTGGAGYIGSHTAVELLDAGYEIVIVDNYANSKPESLNRIRRITGKEFAFCEADCCDKEAVRKIFKENDISTVIHFAGLKAVGESVEKPLEYYKNNIDSTLVLLEVMREFNVKNLIFSSSATVYGAPETVPIKETAKVGNCTNPYGWTKYFIEVILQSQAKADPELSVCLLRYFNPVGAHASGLIGEEPNGIPNNLMPRICRVAAGRMDKMTVFGTDYPTKDGTGVRDYIHVVDLAKGHVASVKYVESHKGCNVFNLGTSVGYSVLEMIKAFEKASGTTIPYVTLPRRAGDIAECYADASKAKELLGWSAEKTLYDMCYDSWKWVKDNPNGYD